MNLNELYITGIDTIDLDHTQIISDLIELRAAPSYERLEAVVKSYNGPHCRLEESLAARSVYPGIKEHIKEHAKIRFEIETKLLRYLHADTQTKSLIVYECYQLFLDHIGGPDRRLAEFLRQKMK